MSKNKRHHHHERPEERPAETPHEQTERLAYHYWEERGRPEGTPNEDWFQAERELERQREAATRL